MSSRSPHSDADAPEGSPPDGGNAPAGARAPGALRRGLRLVGGAVAGVVLLVGAALLALQVEAVSTAAVQWAADWGNPLPGTQLSVERAGGSWVGSIKLVGVRLARPAADRGAPAGRGSVTMATVDTLAVRYSLPALLRGRVHLRSVRIAGPSVTMRQAADSTWDWARALEPLLAGPADTSAAVPVRVDRAVLDRGGYTARFFAGGRDSVASVRGLRLALGGLHAGGGAAPRGRLDTLGLSARLPGDSTALRLGVRAGLTADALRLDTLRLDSPRSRVRGGGLARLPDGPADALDDVDLRVAADPLAFADLAALLPGLGLDPAETVVASARVEGSGARLRLDLDARFSAGGTLSATAAATPRTAPRDVASRDTAGLDYRLDARADALTTSLLGPPDQVRVTARASADLHGPALDRLNGTARLALRNTRYGPLAADSLAARATFADGGAALDLTGTVNRTRLRVRGRARPLDAVPTYFLSGRVDGADLAAFAPGSGLATDLNGTVTASGTLPTEAQANLGAEIELARSRIGVQAVESGRVFVRATPDTVRFDAGLTLPAGSLKATGGAALTGSERFAVRSTEFDRLNVAALAGDSTASRASGQFSAEGQGFDPAAARLDASLSLREAAYGPHRLDTLSATARLDGGALDVSADATLNGGSWTLAATGAPFASAPRLRLTRGRFRALDLGPFLGGASGRGAKAPPKGGPEGGPEDSAPAADTTRMTDLNGTLSASLDGTAPEALALDARLALDSSRVNRQAVEGGRLDLSMREGVVRADLALAAARQRIGLSATAFPLAAAPRVRVETDTLQNVNLGAWAGVEGLDTALNGSLAVDARGASADALVVDGRLDLGAGRVNRAPVDGGTVRFETAQGTGRLGGRLRLAGGGVQVDARADLTADTTAYRLQAALGTLDAGALAGLDSSFAVRVDTARWSLDGRGLDPATLTASTALETGRVLVDRLLIDAVDLRGRVARGVLRLDTLTVASSALGVRGGGTLGFAGPSTTASDLDLVAQIQDARPLRRLLGAERLRLSSGRAEAHVYGTPGRLRFDGRLEVRSLTYNDVRLAGLDVSASGRQGADAAVEQLELDGRLSFLSLPALTVEDTRVRAAYDSSRLDLTSTVRLDRQRTARLEARVDPRPGRERVTVRRADLRLGRDRWSLLQEATVTYTDAVRVRGLLLASSNQQIAADGVLDLDGRQSFVVTVERFRMGAVAEVFGLEGLDGRLSGSAALTGPAAAPRIDGRLDIDVRSRGSDVGTLQLDLAYDSLAATVDARLAHAAGGTLSVTGSLPVDLRLAAPTPADVASRPAQLSVAADSFSLGWIDPFVDPALATNLGGTLAANIEVGGTLDRPVVSGTASLRGGRASLPATGVTYQRATADAALEGEQIRLTNLAVRSPNGGTLRGDGAINLTELTLGEFDLGLTASNFLAIDTRAYRGGTVRGDLTLRGTTRRPVLNGTVGVTSADVYLAEATAASAGSELATVALSEEDQLTLEERFGVRVTAADTTTFDAYEALAMDLGVRLGRDVWIRQQGTPELNIPLTGTLDLSKASMEDPQVFGSIEVVADRGTIRQFGQTFEIDRGTITFNGDPFAPYLDVTAAYEQRSRETQQREVRIELSLEGRPDDLSPRLTSQPPMDTRNILSYLATGQAAGQLLGGGGTGGAGESLSQIPLGIATNFVENLAASNLGLDVVRLQVDPQGGYSLTFGRYVTPRLFVSSQLSSLSRSADATDAREERFGVTLEYQLTDYLLLRTLRRPSDALQINGLLEYSY